MQITSIQTNQTLLKTDNKNANSFGSKLSRKMHNYSKFLTSRKSNTAPKIQHNISIKSLFKTGSNEPKIMQKSAGYDQTDRLQSQQVRRKIPAKQGNFKNSPRTVENEFSGKLYIKLKLESSSFTSKNSFQKCSIDCSQF